MTSKELIDMIQAQDPEGNRIIIFRIEDCGDEYDIEAEGVELVLKNAYQTDEGDRDVLRITIRV